MKRDYNRDLFKNIEELQQFQALLKSELTTYRVDATEKIEQLTQDNQKLRLYNERLKRIFNNNSTNSSALDSLKAILTRKHVYNSREKSGNSSGEQIGHKGKTLTREKVRELLSTRRCEHLVEDLGDITQTYVSRYVVDMESRLVIREFRIHVDGKGCYVIPPELNTAYSRNSKTSLLSQLSSDINIWLRKQLHKNV